MERDVDPRLRHRDPRQEARLPWLRPLYGQADRIKRAQSSRGAPAAERTVQSRVEAQGPMRLLSSQSAIATDYHVFLCEGRSESPSHQAASTLGSRVDVARRPERGDDKSAISSGAPNRPTGISAVCRLGELDRQSGLRARVSMLVREGGP